MRTYHCLPFAAHPLRESLYEELHSRPFYAVATPCRIFHLAMLAEAAEAEVALERVRELCRSHGVRVGAETAAHLREDCGAFTVHWERHLEFYSVTFLRPWDGIGEPFAEGLEPVAAEWLATLPGQAVATFHLTVARGEGEVDEARLRRLFDGGRLVASRPARGKALLATAFQLHGDGAGRFYLENRGLKDYQMGGLVRRVVELETYRLLAMLSLPGARRLAPELTEMDRQLAAILAAISAEPVASAARHDLLYDLSQLAARLEAYRAETNYRISASRAYHELVLSRLRSIREEVFEGYLTVHDFLTRRLDPAQRTCESVQRRMEDLSRRIERASDLLRTGVNITLQEQNKSLLASMDRRSRLQFRLQETVEGLSVAAISYYTVGLFSYLLSGVPLDRWGLSKKVVLACLVPGVVGLVWWGTNRIKHRLIQQPAAEEG